MANGCIIILEKLIFMREGEQYVDDERHKHLARSLKSQHRRTWYPVSGVLRGYLLSFPGAA
eukprot:3991906-Pleurochrysis_carterae.AAC.1